MEWLNTLLHNTWFVGCAMAILIFGITELIKQPIKKLTSKCIKNERIRKMVNTVILLIPFALGVAFEFLFKTYYLHTIFNGITGLHYGTAAVTLYGFIERFFNEKGVKVTNPYKTEEGEAVLNLVDELTSDSVLDGEDTPAVREFLEKISKQ